MALDVKSTGKTKPVGEKFTAVEIVLSNLKGYGQSRFSSEKPKLIKNLENIRKGREASQLTPLHEIILIQKFLEQEMSLTQSKNPDPKLSTALENFNNEHKLALELVDKCYVPYTSLLFHPKTENIDLFAREEEALLKEGINSKDFREKYKTARFIEFAKSDIVKVRTETRKGNSDKLKKDAFLAYRFGILNINLEEYIKEQEAKAKKELIKSSIFAFHNNQSTPENGKGVELSDPRSQSSQLDDLRQPKKSTENKKSPADKSPKEFSPAAGGSQEEFFPSSSFWSPDSKSKPPFLITGRHQKEISLSDRASPKSVNLDEAEKYFSLGNDFANGSNGRKKDFKEACKNYNLAAELGYPAAQTQLGIWYENGIGVGDPDKSEAFRLYSLAADEEYAPAQYRLGMCYKEGIGGEPDVNQAWKYISLAAKQRHAPAQYELGCWYNTSPETSKKAIEYFILAANQGDVKAVSQLISLAKAGNSDVNLLTTLSKCYRQGLGVAKDLREASNLRKRAQKKIPDDEKPTTASKSSLLNFPNPLFKIESPTVLLDQAAKGSVRAMLAVGKGFLNGEKGFGQDSELALKWFIKAAEEGDADAAYYAGLCYDVGLSSEEEREKALLYYKQASAGGHRAAELKLRSISSTSLPEADESTAEYGF